MVFGHNPLSSQIPTQNPFAALSNCKGEDFRVLKTNRSAFSSDPSRVSEIKRAEIGRGRGGYGRGSGKDGLGQFGDSRANGYQLNYYGDKERYSSGDISHSKGRDLGRGRGFNENLDHGVGNGNQVYGSNENQNASGDEWIKVARSRDTVHRSESCPSIIDNTASRNENWNAHGKRKGFGGDNRGFRDATKSTKKRKDSQTGKGNSEHWVHPDVSKKEMTLDEYEKLIAEKRNALRALQNEERKVSLDKDFDTMQRLQRKEEDSFFLRLNSVKGTLKQKDSLGKK